MRRAFSFIEVLAVILIIILLAALLFPVFARAKADSKTAVCTSNLRQLFVSMQLYRDQHDGNLPASMGEFMSKHDYGILKCPSDPTPSGDNTVESKALTTRVSTYFLPNLSDFRDAIAKADPNFGVAYCANHGEPTTDDVLDSRSKRTGLVLRLLIDGSVHRVKVPRWCSAADGNGTVSARPDWMLLTDQSGCPERFCAPLVEPCKNP